jgi:hypothetical protein
VSTAAVDVPSVVLNCGTASVCNGYRRRPQERGSGGAGAAAGGGAGGGAGAGGAVAIDKHAVPVKFSGSVDEEGVDAVQGLVFERPRGRLRSPTGGPTSEWCYQGLCLQRSSH